jgi:putative membrane protein (TIGR04086 family)
MNNKFVNYLKEGVATLIVSVIFALILLLLSAMLLKIFDFDPKVIPVFNTVIKILAVLFSVFVCLKTPTDGWVRGIISGVLFVVISHVLFGVISSDLSFGISLMLDIVLGAVSGFVGGILTVNVKRKTAT